MGNTISEKNRLLKLQLLNKSFFVPFCLLYFLYSLTLH